MGDQQSSIKNPQSSVCAVRAMAAAAVITGWLGHAGNSSPAALGEENGQLAPGMLPAADCTRDGRVGLIHRSDRLEGFFAILTDIFVNWHNHLSGTYPEIQEEFAF